MLEKYGTKHVFGLPGDTSMALYDAFHGASGIQHILVRDERSSAYMADAYARVTGKVGVCEGPSGGGALYIIPGVSEADGSRVPIVCFTSDTPLTSEDRGSLTSLEQTRVFEAVTRFTSRVVLGSKIPETIRRAFRFATANRMGASHIALPENIIGEQMTSLDEADVYSEPRHMAYPAYRFAPCSDDLEKACEAIKEASKPVILAGGGVHLSEAYEELAQFAGLLHIPVATSLNGKGAFDETSALALGVIGTNGAKCASNEALAEADLVIVLGSRLNASTTAGLLKSKKVIQVDTDAAQIGNTTQVEVALAGDAREVLRAFIRICAGFADNRDLRWTESVGRRIVEEMNLLEPNFSQDTLPFAPMRLVRLLNEALPSDSIVVCDAGTPTPHVAAYYRPNHAGRTFVAGRAHGSLGYAIPAAIGAKVGQPCTPVVAVFGDGSFEMAMSELETISRLEIPIIMVCTRNGSYNWIKCLQQIYYEERYFGVDFGHKGDYCDLARAYGIQAIRPESGTEMKEAIASAIRSERPLFLDVPTEPMTSRVPPVRAWQQDMAKPASQRVRKSY